MSIPAIPAKIIELAPNSRVLAVLAQCPVCGRGNVKIHSGWSAYEHRSAVSGGMCPGPNPESLFTAILGDAGLDVRPRSDDISWVHYGDATDEWSQRNGRRAGDIQLSQR